MELIQISQQIQDKIKLLEKMRTEIRERGEKKAETLAKYEMVLAQTIIKLKNGVPMELDGKEIGKTPVTLIEKIARGICWEEKLEADKMDALYKSCIVNIQTVEAELNGYQSIFRHLEKA